MNNLNWWLKWLATAFTIAGAMAVTLELNWWDLILLKTGSLLWITWAWRIREYSLVTVNIMMIVIYGYGIVIKIA